MKHVFGESPKSMQLIEASFDIQGPKDSEVREEDLQHAGVQFFWVMQWLGDEYGVGELSVSFQIRTLL